MMIPRSDIDPAAAAHFTQPIVPFNTAHQLNVLTTPTTRFTSAECRALPTCACKASSTGSITFSSTSSTFAETCVELLIPAFVGVGLVTESGD